MIEIGAKFKRQIEILGIAINNPESLGTDDLAELYGVERLTIKRDLQELRSSGFDVHSEGKRGVRIARKIDAARIQGLVSSYLALSNVGASVDKASALLTKKLNMDALGIAVAIQRCIEDSVQARITYVSERANKDVEFTVSPIQVFQAHGLWRLLADHEGVVKQFLLTKLVTVTPTGNRCRPISRDKVDELFRYSLGGWTGTERHHFTLRLSKELATRLQARQSLLFDSLKEGRDGWYIADGTVNSIGELATWLVGMGGGVIAVSPAHLRNMVCRIASASLNNYVR
jgi:predicted DNA-binding transcriptional regulator YafY